MSNAVSDKTLLKTKRNYVILTYILAILSIANFLISFLYGFPIRIVLIPTVIALFIAYAKLDEKIERFTITTYII